MNYAHKELFQALKALKQATQRRKLAEAILQENPATITLTALSGKTVTLTLYRDVAACRELAVNAADEVVSQAWSQELAAEKHVAYWAREVALLADKEAEQLAQQREPVAENPAA